MNINIMYQIPLGRENYLININHKHLSRIHSTILFDSYKNKWIIIDGDLLDFLKKFK